MADDPEYVATLPATLTDGATLPPGESVDPFVRAMGDLGRFQIVRRIGAGGMGIVFEAHDRELDRKVAIKVLRGAGGASSWERLRREAQTMARLSHRNIVTVFDIVMINEQLLIAMELVAGGTLRDLDGTKRPVREVLRLVIAAGRGLAAAHAAGVIHRDFKPDNVLVGTDGTVRVADFGLASNEVTGDATGNKNVMSLAGTIAYMAPERILGETTANSDQFAFSVTVYELLEGVRPFDSRSTPMQFRDVVTSGAKRTWTRREVPRSVRNAIDRGMHPDASMRWPDIDSLLAELERSLRSPRRIATGGIVIAAAMGALATAGLARTEAQQIGIEQFAVSPARQITFDGESASPVLSRDRRLLAYARRTRGDVVIHDLSTGNARVVATDSLPRRWSPDGRNLLVFGPMAQLQLIARDGGAARAVGRCAFAAFSGDGSEVLWQCPDPLPVWTFFNVHAGTSRTVSLSIPDMEWLGGVDWSAGPRGTIVVLSGEKVGHSLWTFDPDGSSLRRIYRDSSSNAVIDVRWNADRSRIYYARERDAAPELVELIYDASTRTATEHRSLPPRSADHGRLCAFR